MLLRAREKDAICIKQTNHLIHTQTPTHVLLKIFISFVNINLTLALHVPYSYFTIISKIFKTRRKYSPCLFELEHQTSFRLQTVTCKKSFPPFFISQGLIYVFTLESQVLPVMLNNAKKMGD